jgi:hypothetical protein
MKDLGFNEFGDLEKGMGDEESGGSTVEMQNLMIDKNGMTIGGDSVDDEGDKEMEDTEIAI